MAKGPLRSLAAIMFVITGGAVCAPVVPAPVPVEVLFDPAAGVLPFPHDLLFTGSTDGTLAIPVEPDAPANDPRLALNQLDGFSRTMPIRVGFSRAIAPETVVPGQSVRAFSVTTTGPAGLVTGVVRELIAGRDYTTAVSADAASILVVPLAPLPDESCLVVVTNQVSDAAGVSVVPSRVYKLARGRNRLLTDDGSSARPDLIDDATAAKLEPLRVLVSSTEAAVSPFGLDEEDVALSFTFTLQSTSETFAALRAAVVFDEATGALRDDVAMSALPLFATDAIGGAGIANVFLGAFRLPGYLAPDDPLGGRFVSADGGAVTRFAAPKALAALVVPALVTVPGINSGHVVPAAGWPVVVFQHGLTGDRTQLLLIADALASVGFIGVAIDLPLHGLTANAAHPFAGLEPLVAATADGYRSNAFAALGVLGAPVERAPTLDLLDNATGAPGADTLIDTSGKHFINLRSLLTARDNIRQAVADLMRVRRLVGGLRVDAAADGVTDLIDDERVFFVGHSLGAIVGTVLQGVDGDAWRGAVLANPGGGIAQLLLGSQTFGPEVEQGLAAGGIVRGSPEFDGFFLAAQTVFDATDPIVFATQVPGPFVVFQQRDDAVVPNAVDGAPLSGTEPLLKALDTFAIGTGALSFQGPSPRAAVRFSRGTHSSFLDPSIDQPVTVEMQGVMARFLASNGTAVRVVDREVVASQLERVR